MPDLTLGLSAAATVAVLRTSDVSSVAVQEGRMIVASNTRGVIEQVWLDGARGSQPLFLPRETMAVASHQPDFVSRSPVPPWTGSKGCSPPSCSRWAALQTYVHCSSRASPSS